MSAHLIDHAQAEGVTITLNPVGTLKVAGEGAAVTQWTPTIREHKAELLAILRGQVDARFHAWVSRHLPVDNAPLSDCWAKIAAGQLLLLTLEERRALRCWVPQLVNLLGELAECDYPQAMSFARLLNAAEDSWGFNRPDVREN